MKKAYFLLSCAIFVLVSCRHDASISNSSGGSSPEKQYDAISALGYIGGAVVYNPSNPDFSQLFSGANIAVYQGKLTATTVNADVFNPNVLDDTSINWDENIPIDSVNLNDSQDTYGYLNIQSVSSQSISATFYSFSQDGKSKHSSSFTLSTGQKKDLDGDGKPDISYVPLVPVRDGFEDAMCLEFISSQTDLYTTMYATITDDLLTRSAMSSQSIRSVSEYKNSTFYGMNSDGSFIYITGEDSNTSLTRGVINYSSTVGIAHGDYVIDQHTGEIFAVVGNVPESDKSEDISSPFGDLSLKSSEDYETSSDSYDILIDDNYELEKFFTYLYRKNQFASDDGPLELLKKLPQQLLSSDISLDNCSPDRAIEELCDILTKGSIVEIIAEAKKIDLRPEDEEYIQTVLFEYLKAIFDDNVYQQCEAQKGNPAEIQKIVDDNWNNLQIDETLIKEAYLDLIAMNRLYIENNYPESPRAIVPVPEFTTVYPLMSLKIGDIPTELDGELPPEAQPSTRYVLAPEQLNENFSNFLKKKKQIQEDFSKFYAFNLSKINISNLKGDNEPKVEQIEEKKEEKKDPGVDIYPGTCHVDLKIGITGSLNSRWGYIKSDLGSAIYFALDANLKEFAQSLSLFDTEIFDKSTSFMVGPIPITIGFSGKIGMSVDANILTSQDTALQFVGMYGGGVSFSANYGIKKGKKYHIPYVYGYLHPTIDGHTIHQTGYYAGSVTKEQNFANSQGCHVVLKPYFTLFPKIALGPKYAYAGIQLPIGIYVNGGYAMYSDSAIDKDKLMQDNWFKIKNIVNDYNIWQKTTIGSSIVVSPVLGVKIPGLNKKLQTTWKALTLVRGELAMQGDGSIKLSGGYMEW